MIVDMLRNDLGRVAETGQRSRSRALRGRAAPDPPPDDLERRGAQRGPALRGLRSPLPLRVGHRGAQGPDHGDHRGAGGGAPRGLHRRPRLGGGGPRLLLGGHPHRRGRSRAATRSLQRRKRRRGRLPRGGRVRGMPAQGPHPRGSGRSSSWRRWPSCPARAIGGSRAISRVSGVAPPTSACPSRAWTKRCERALVEHARQAGPTRVRLLVDLFGRVRLESAPLAPAGSESPARGAGPRPDRSRQPLAPPQDDAPAGLRPGPRLPPRLRRRAAVERPRGGHRGERVERGGGRGEERS